ncbi:hypothetical protein CANCADRAFT_19962, partial [Tortispora caseinolytica NRRL Y-17796]
ASSAPLENDAQRFGIQGILGAVRRDSSDISMLSLGTDLNSFRMPFNSSESLSRSFSTPWPESESLRVEPDFRLPECYSTGPLPDQRTRMDAFNDETLFYIFYSMPRDVLQEAAATELTNRHWRYHKELKLWLTKDPASEPIQQSAQAERGIYIFFDPIAWEKTKKEYILYYASI